MEGREFPAFPSSMSKYWEYPPWQEPQGLVELENTGAKNIEVQIAKVSVNKKNEALCFFIMDSVKVLFPPYVPVGFAKLWNRSSYPFLRNVLNGFGKMPSPTDALYICHVSTNIIKGSRSPDSPDSTPKLAAIIKKPCPMDPEEK